MQSAVDNQSPFSVPWILNPKLPESKYEKESIEYGSKFQRGLTKLHPAKEGEGLMGHFGTRPNMAEKQKVPGRVTANQTHRPLK